MKFKAVFFDWFNTLARYEPPREELHGQALREFGFEVAPDKLRRGVFVADKYFFEENARSPVEKREPKEKAEVYIRYQQLLMNEVGVKADRDLILKIMTRAHQLFAKINFALFDDVLSTLKTLKKQNLTLGLLTNLAQDMNPICRKLGLEPYLDFFVTSGEVGADKPEPPIFLAALQKAGVKASEAVHIGDQYKMDVMGAKGVGINPILLDRYDLYHEVTDCPRIHRLTELPKYLQ